jgi:hypothetical protein
MRPLKEKDMYGLPDDTDLSNLIGCTLGQISFSQFQLIFTFRPDATISVEGRCQLASTDQNVLATWENSAPSDIGIFGRLLERSILNVEIASNTLVLHFCGELKLSIFDSNADHESYQITTPGRTLVI